MARLFERDAPGVSCICKRSTKVEGVTVSDWPASAETVIVCFSEGRRSSRCRIGVVAESTVIVCSSVTKVASETETVYSPSGTASKWNSPPEFVCALCVNSELRALRITVMPGTGRCCGSCTMPRTLPKSVPAAPAVANRRTGRTLIRRICSPNGLVRGQNARGASESTKSQDGPPLRRLAQRFGEEEREVQSKRRYFVIQEEEQALRRPSWR